MVVRAYSPNSLGNRWEITWAQKFQATVSYDCTSAFQPERQSETLSLKKQQKKEKTENKKISLKIK